MLLLATQSGIRALHWNVTAGNDNENALHLVYNLCKVKAEVLCLFALGLGLGSMKAFFAATCCPSGVI